MLFTSRTLTSAIQISTAGSSPIRISFHPALSSFSASKNLVDEVWINRPPAEINAVIVHPVKFAGRSVADKLKDLRKKLVHEQTRGIIFTALDEVSASSR